MLRPSMVFAAVAALCLTAGTAAAAIADSHRAGGLPHLGESPALSSSAAAGSGSGGATAAMSMNAKLHLNSVLGGCVPVGAAEACGARTISGRFPGLGEVSGAYSFPVDLGPPACPGGDPSETGRGLAYSMQLTVAEKGYLEVDVADGQCVTPAYRSTQTFTIVGGTGVYVGASGSGTLSRTLGESTASGRSGLETWAGTLSVPGLEFDLTPPTLAGATNTTVRAKKGAKSARVVFKVTAQDDRDPSPEVTCMPRSGSRFPLGKTRVSCSAIDSSANTRTALFAITVKKTR